MSELKPCPFCGCAITLDRAGWLKGVHDENCPFDAQSLPFTGESWNRRAADEQVRELVDAIRKLLKALGAWREHDWEHWHESIEDPIGDVEDILRKHGKE